MATIEEREEALNKKCMECREKYGKPSFDHCEYYCQTGKEIHKLDFEKSRKGWGSHDYWKEPH